MGEDADQEGTLADAEVGGDALGLAADREMGPPQSLAHYELRGELGRGGMGVVYVAEDRKLDRKVAIKTLRTPGEDRARARLVREAKALAKLSHPNVVRIYEIGEVEGAAFIVMEFVEGRTLGAWLAEEQPSLAELLAVFQAAGRGLQAIHAAGLIHRDVKPDNLMIDDEGRVLVMDLGIARSDDSVEPELRESAELDAPPETLTRTGALLGSPAYMAPEQFRAEALTARVDQFSLCVTLWEAVYGERPFAGRTLGQLMSSVSEGRLREPEGGRAPAWLRRVLERGLAADPKRRFESMAALVEALAGPRWPRGRVGGLVLGGLGLGLAALAGFLLFTLGRSEAGREHGRGEGSPTAVFEAPPVDAKADAAAAETEGPSAAGARSRVLEQRGDHIALAPDGRSVVYAAEGRLWLVDLDGGDERELAGGLLRHPRFGPEGALWFLDGRPEQGGVHRLVELEGEAEPERVSARLGVFCLRADPPELIVADDVSASLRRVELGPGRPVERGTVELGEWARGGVEALACDPRGPRVVALAETDRGRRLQSVALDGGASRVLIEHGDALRAPRFDATGERLYFVAARGLGPQLETLRFEAGVPVPAGLVLPGVRVDDFDLGPEGTLAYLSIDWRWHLRELDPAQRVLAEGRVILESRADSLGWELAPDRRAIGYVESWGSMGRLKVRELDGGEPRELAAALGSVDLAWSPDGRSIAYVAAHRGEPRIWIVPVAGGEAELLADTHVAQSKVLLWPTADRLVYERAGSGYVIHELEGGGERPLLSDAEGGERTSIFRLTAEPGGRQLAGHRDRDPRGLWIVPLEGAPPRPLLPGRHYPTDWFADGRSLLTFNPARPHRLDRVDVETGELSPWRELELDGARATCMLGLEARLVCGSESSTRTLTLTRLD